MFEVFILVATTLVEKSARRSESRATHRDCWSYSQSWCPLLTIISLIIRQHFSMGGIGAQETCWSFYQDRIISSAVGGMNLSALHCIRFDQIRCVIIAAHQQPHPLLSRQGCALSRFAIMLKPWFCRVHTLTLSSRAAKISDTKKLLLLLIFARIPKHTCASHRLHTLDHFNDSSNPIWVNISTHSFVQRRNNCFIWMKIVVRCGQEYESVTERISNVWNDSITAVWIT